MTGGILVTAVESSKRGGRLGLCGMTSFDGYGYAMLEIVAGDADQAFETEEIIHNSPDLRIVKAGKGCLQAGRRRCLRSTVPPACHQGLPLLHARTGSYPPVKARTVLGHLSRYPKASNSADGTYPTRLRGCQNTASVSFESSDCADHILPPFSSPPYSDAFCATKPLHVYGG